MSNLTSGADVPWVRGVNLGGWLVMERYITPYQFAITDCHVRGDFCWYPGQISAPSRRDPNYKLCDPDKCSPLRVPNAFGNVDFPVDEKTLAAAFFMNETGLTEKEAADTAMQWFNYHFDNFIQTKDLKLLKEAGVTHLRVPLPHWILGDVVKDEPWIVGKRWDSFVRVCNWARELGLEVWPDVHTADPSQNGFDNSGQALPYMTCQAWSNNPVYVNRSLNAIRDITAAVVEAKIEDVVTGFGLLNEPYADCPKEKYLDFIERGFKIVRNTLGPNTAVYVSDMFQEKNFNDGTWWLDPTTHNNTFLDSHYYQVFDEVTRDLSPRQHVAFACENHFRRSTGCCYTDPPTNTMPSQGVSRMVGEWSASFDILPAARITEIMDGIAETGVAPYFDRKLSLERQEFLRDFVEAQIVTFESADVGTASAWFYWTAKMEGGAFAEWSFLRGYEEGWFPTIPDRDTASQSVFGTCHDILFRTDDNVTIVEEFPKPGQSSDKTFTVVDDDVVLSHGESLIHPFPVHHRNAFQKYCILVGGLVACLAFAHRKIKLSKRAKYSELARDITV